MGVSVNVGDGSVGRSVAVAVSVTIEEGTAVVAWSSCVAVGCVSAAVGSPPGGAGVSDGASVGATSVVGVSDG